MRDEENYELMEPVCFFKKFLGTPHMKNLSFFLKTVLAASGIIIIAILLARNNEDAALLSLRVKSYERRVDSLRSTLKEIGESVHQKDSMLLIYLASLEKTLEELNRESAKNKESIDANLLKQEAVRNAYCRAMAKLEQHPEECQ